jgi:hypothetical protein
MAGVANGAPKNEDRGFILEYIEVCISLPALWDVRSKEYSNRQKKKKKDKFCLTNTESVTQKQTEGR